MRLILLLFLLTSLTVAPVAAQTDALKYAGLRYGPTQPKGVKYVSGALISERNDEKEYGISEVHKGRVKALWFERLARRDERGIPYWELLDVLVAPPHTGKQILVYASCRLKNQYNPEIVALVDNQPSEEFLTRVRKAWRANRQTGKFEVLPTKGIKCTNQALE